MTEALKDGVYTRLSGYNKPKIFFAFALMAVLVNACAQPIFGGFIMSRLLVVLATPSPYLLIIHPNDKPEMKIKTALDLGRFTPKELEDNHFEVLESRTTLYTLLIVAVAVSVGVAGWIQKYFFSLLGENVTFQIRKDLYATILRKNMGWFDLRENSTGVISSTMATDTAIINGVGGESLGP